MKAHSTEKRNQEMYVLRSGVPRVTYREIAELYGVSTPRARQIVEREIRARREFRERYGIKEEDL